MKKRKLNYILYNPNTVEDTAKVLLDIFIQANEGKVERKIKEMGHCYVTGSIKEHKEDVKSV